MNAEKKNQEIRIGNRIRIQSKVYAIDETIHKMSIHESRVGEVTGIADDLISIKFEIEIEREMCETIIIASIDDIIEIEPYSDSTKLIMALPIKPKPKFVVGDEIVIIDDNRNDVAEIIEIVFNENDDEPIYEIEFINECETDRKRESEIELASDAYDRYKKWMSSIDDSLKFNQERKSILSKNRLNENYINRIEGIVNSKSIDALKGSIHIIIADAIGDGFEAEDIRNYLIYRADYEIHEQTGKIID